MSTTAELMKALEAQMEDLRARMVAEEAAKDVAGKVAAVEQRTKEKVAKTEPGTRSQPGDVAGGGRWKRVGGGMSGSESASSAAPPTIKDCIDVAVYVLAAEQASTEPGTRSQPGDVDLASSVGAETPPDWSDADMSDARGRPSVLITEVCSSSAPGEHNDASDKKRAKKARQAERRKAEKVQAKTAKHEQYISELRLGAHTTLDPKAKVRPAPKRLFGPPPTWDNIKCKLCPTQSPV